MAICKFNLDNFEYNIESNMAAMSLPLPKTVFGSITTVSAALAAIETALSVKAYDVPLSVVSAGRASKQLAGIGAAFWAGAIIGSALMASKRATSCNRLEFKEAFRTLGLPSWAADAALSSHDGHKLLRKN
ncbi:hypothetical protein [Vibrio neptunius]|uniref:hypothetical protein n=1 Tax=Vibrio neptunius TaxID=170651 RepID=UPI0019D1DB41|nr:hypothetical protein [Vibrio neptunius]MBN3572074.1 hypothetical protein [Vibrio neptunius]